MRWRIKLDIWIYVMYEVDLVYINFYHFTVLLHIRASEEVGH